MQTATPTPAIDPQSASYYNGGKYQPGSAQAPSGSANSTAPAVPYQVPQNNISSQISAANTTSQIPTTSPVFNANAAQEDYQAKLAAYKLATTALDQQASTQQRVQLDAAANQAAKDLQTSELGLRQQSNQIQQTQADAANTAAQAKLTAANGLSGAPATPQNAPGTTQTPPTSNPSPSQNPAIQTSQNTLDYIQNVQGIQDQRTQALSSFLNTANTMIVGLQSSEAALVNATTQQFQNILNAQQQSNASQLGAAQENAARTGQEYNPTGAASTIANVISQGNQRLSEINSTMATTIANLDMNFAKEQYDLMNSNFAKLDQSFTDRMAAFTEVHNAVALDATTQAKAQQDARDFAYKQQQDEISNNLAVQKFNLDSTNSTFKNNLDAKNSAADITLKRAQVAKIYSDMSSADTSTASDWVKNIQSGTAKLTDVPKNLKNAVAAGLANGNPQGVNSLLSTTQKSIEDLNSYVADNHGFTSAVGAKGLSSFFGLKGGPIAGSSAADFDAKLKQVTNDVVLPNLTILHGLGRVTDREFQSLQAAITSLSPNLSEGEFKKELGSVTDLINQKIQETNTHNGIQLPKPETTSAGAFQGITLPN